MDKHLTIWKIEPHTEIKHHILKNYLAAWMPILGSKNKRVIFIDGFAGPGEYVGGKKGSPIIALKTAINHKTQTKTEYTFLFIEAREDRYNHLKKVISKIKIPSKLKIVKYVRYGKFEEEVNSLLTNLEERGVKIAPTFLFIDPFGFSGAPFYLIKKFMENRKCEVFISFMCNSIRRWQSLLKNEENLDMLFGTKEWRGIMGNQKTSSDEKNIELRNLYQQQLENNAGIEFVRSFKMINKQNKTEYFLFFGTNHLLGLKKMLEAMWGSDPSGKFEFFDTKYDPKQTVLFSLSPNYSQLKKKISKEFTKKSIKMKDLETFAIEEASFLKKHLRKVLLEMEKNKEINVHLQRKRKRETFPDDAVINFLK